MEASILIVLRTATNPLNYFAASVVGKWTAATRPTCKPTYDESDGMTPASSRCNCLRNVEYSIQLVMSELSTVRCDRVLGLWLQVHGVECRRRVAVEELRPGGS